MSGRGFYEDHLRAVAERQARKMQAGVSEREIRKFLLWAGWNAGEVDRIMDIAERMCKNG